MATTVGPYRRGGLELVDACIAAGAHYCDLTGEILFAHESVQRHDGGARRPACGSSTACGFDSIPSDLGTFLLHEHAGELGPTRRSSSTALKGGPSGGTLASMKGQIDEAHGRQGRAQDRLRPVRARRRRPAASATCARSSRHKQLGWIGPFVMATYNTRIVRRSHSLLDYGPRLPLPRGLALREPGDWRSASPPASARSPAASPSRPTRKLLDRVLPDPGEGPSENARAHRLLPDGDPRRRPRRHGRRQGRPGLRRDRGDDGRERALPGARRRAPPARAPACSRRRPRSACRSIERLRAAGMTLEVDVNNP